MTINKANIIVRRKNGIALPAPQGKPASAEVLASFLNALSGLGFSVDDKAFAIIKELSDEQITALYNDYVPMIAEGRGAHVRYRPMYPNFPQQVMEASDAELFLNAMMHYLGDAVGIRIMPIYSEAKRLPIMRRLLRNITLTPVTEDEFLSIFPTLLSSKVAFGLTEVSDMAWFVEHEWDAVAGMVPEDIPNKENLAHFLIAVKAKDIDLFTELLKERAKTATDLLRVAVAMGGQSASLSRYPAVYFGKFPKPVRRAFLDALNDMNEPVSDMLRHVALWKTFGEKLHPGQYSVRYPKAYDAFSTIRNGLPSRTFASVVEKRIGEGDVKGAVELLTTRPGEFARRLDHLLRSAETEWEADFILSNFASVAPNVATNVLWKLRSHFLHRSDRADLRHFYIKGEMARLKSIPNTLPTLPGALVEKAVEVCSDALKQALSTRDSLGKVYVSPALASHTVPEAVRSANRSLNLAGRGTRVPFAEDTVQRFFLWWHDVDGSRTDLDLSVVAYDADYQTIGNVWYGNLRNHTLGIAHSGDITSAPKGASEFIDIDIRKAKAAGVRYLTMSVISFTGQPLHTLKDCFAGVMSRPDGQSGEIYDPRTVANKFDLSADGSTIIPMIIDLEKNEYVWADVALSGRGSGGNVINSGPRFGEISRSIVEKEYVSLYDVFLLNAQARGEVVDSPDDADLVLSVDDIGRVTESAENISANYL